MTEYLHEEIIINSTNEITNEPEYHSIQNLFTEKDYQKFDGAIRGFLKSMNDVPIVSTMLSCQGHFLKHCSSNSICYYEYKKDEDGDKAMTSHTLYSRIKYPFIVLHFHFEKDWKRIRSALFDLKKECPENVIIVPIRYRKEVLDIYKRFRGIVINFFDKKYVSIAAYKYIPKNISYNKNRGIMNNKIKKMRDVLFEFIIDLLKDLFNTCYSSNTS